jgi:hypothetical protein
MLACSPALFTESSQTTARAIVEAVLKLWSGATGADVTVTSAMIRMPSMFRLPPDTVMAYTYPTWVRNGVNSTPKPKHFSNVGLWTLSCTLHADVIDCVQPQLTAMGLIGVNVASEYRISSIAHPPVDLCICLDRLSMGSVLDVKNSAHYYAILDKYVALGGSCKTLLQSHPHLTQWGASWRHDFLAQPLFRDVLETVTIDPSFLDAPAVARILAQHVRWSKLRVEFLYACLSPQ